MRVSQSLLLAVSALTAVVPAVPGKHSSPDDAGRGEQKLWALLVAGSKGYNDYRHQADICHAYHVLQHHGIPDERIVVMMYDDIAYNELNPMKGVVMNHPYGSNVYYRVPKDYTGGLVNPLNFVRILQGQRPYGGSGKVIASGPNDHIFVNFVGHGGTWLPFVSGLRAACP
ncbi:hypothetical protein MTO96_020755 [Rhipicephalus appendiculatus]